jgi:hypothetical protein
LDEKTENTKIPEAEMPVLERLNPAAEKASSILYIIPVLLCVFFFAGFTQLRSEKVHVPDDNSRTELKKKKEPMINFSALVSGEEFSQNIRDTVYTDKNLWCELRIDEQQVHIHYRDGHSKTYAISTGNKFLSKGIESRPGLFAIFHKEEVHLSSQFNDARMNYYMPFNMGIGFHGLPGTGYYGNLGVRPSSHGCIRMRNEDVKVLFKEADIGTLVLVHRGATTRTIAFAPEGFKNEAEYSKDDYMNLLAYNLSAICEGNYFVYPPKRFILDGNIIPRYGINVRSADEIPAKQQLPVYFNTFGMADDRLEDSRFVKKGNVRDAPVAENIDINESQESTGSVDLGVSPETIKKYVYNPIGILPYFPPNK